MEIQGKSPSLWGKFFQLGSPQIRAFHMSWFAFFLCFFAWFGIAPLIKKVEAELSLTQEQLGWSIIASVAITVVARLFIGWLCDRIGPRLSYTWLLLVGSIPVISIAFVNSFETFIVARLFIGVIGASFVITQYHTTVMFAPNVVGVANATSAGWGNMGGGVTQLVMPLMLAFFVGVLGFSESIGWRSCMMGAGILCALTGVAYFFLTQDTPEGNFKELRAQGKLVSKEKSKGAFRAACSDYRVWALFVVYGACFGVELTVNNTLARYFANQYEMTLILAGAAAASFGLMNLFARTLGGYFGDVFGGKWGLKGRVTWLFVALFFEGIFLMVFAKMTILALALPALIVFSLFVQMSEGATFSVVPFVNKRALGPVAGIVGAGGNAGAVAAGFLFKSMDYSNAFFVLGAVVLGTSFCAFLVRFNEEAEEEAKTEYDIAVARRHEELKQLSEQNETELIGA